MLRAVLIAATLLGVAFQRNDDGDSTSESLPRLLESRHLKNLVRLHPKVISGGLPEGTEAFKELRSLGVKTIISVDGQKPDLETACKFGMRYVHLPHGYNGISEERAMQLAKAVRDLDGPIYVHCHHGKHRSPAAASVACVAAGLIPASQSVDILRLAGTSPHYRGLFQSARQVEPLKAQLLDELEVDFPESAEVPPMAESMVGIEHTHDRLKAIAAAGWRTPVDHPDLDPPHEALLMREHFTELLRCDEVHRQPAKFKKLLQDSETAASKLEQSLRQWNPESPQDNPPQNLLRFSGMITQNCISCHQQYRDVPLSEK